MRLIDKSDTSLVIALIAGAVVMFQRPLRLLFDAARTIETRYDIDLIPGLVVLCGAFVFHQYRKRQQAKVAAGLSAAEVTKERQRSAELERLVAFGAAVGNAIDLRGIRQAFWRFMPAFSRDREVWMLTSGGESWEPVALDTATAAQYSAETLERLARNTLASPSQTDARADGVLVDGNLCFPMAAGETSLGVVGVRHMPPLLAGERRALGAAIAILSSALRNVQLLALTRESGLRDQLTGCFNRAYALETLGSELQRAKRSGRPLSVMMFDIDRFKRTNDDYGHLTGDAILAAVAGQCASTLRASDIKCRWGGDEFLILLPDTPLHGAAHASGSLTRDVASLRVPAASGTISPTISVGVAVADPGEDDPMSLIARADDALYKAKHSGRNRFVIAQPDIRAAS
jgi:diguanylate cyclase (GGDEF)-like protein